MTRYSGPAVRRRTGKTRPGSKEQSERSTAASPVTARRAAAVAIAEIDLQHEVMGLCRDLGLYHYHPWTSVNSAAGWPDSVIIGNRVLFRELKSQSGRLTREQAEVGRKLKAAGQNWRVWRPSDLLSGQIAKELTEVAAVQAELFSA
jgi:hypothetical protein